MKKDINYGKLTYILMGCSILSMFLSALNLIFLLGFIICALLAAKVSSIGQAKEMSKLKEMYNMDNAVTKNDSGIMSFKNVNSYNPHNKENEEKLEKLIQQNDPNFSKSFFKQKAYNYYIEYQKAILNGNLDILYSFATKEVVEKAKQVKKEELLSNTKVEYSYITNYSRQVDYEMIEYQLTISGNNSNKIYYNTYRLIFTRSIGVMTKLNEELNNLNCPNCGAITNIISYGKCNHCNQIINTGKYSWILKSIDYWKGENKNG